MELTNRLHADLPCVNQITCHMHQLTHTHTQNDDDVDDNDEEEENLFLAWILIAFYATSYYRCQMYFAVERENGAMHTQHS